MVALITTMYHLTQNVQDSVLKWIENLQANIQRSSSDPKLHGSDDAHVRDRTHVKLLPTNLVTTASWSTIAIQEC